MLPMRFCALLNSFGILGLRVGAKKVLSRRLGRMLVTGVIHGAIVPLAGHVLGVFVIRGRSSTRALEPSSFNASAACGFVGAFADWSPIWNGILVFLIRTMRPRSSMREHLEANHFTMHWNPVLRIGVAAARGRMCGDHRRSDRSYAAMSALASMLAAFDAALNETCAPAGLWAHSGWASCAGFADVLAGFACERSVPDLYRKAADPSVQAVARNQVDGRRIMDALLSGEWAFARTYAPTFRDPRVILPLNERHSQCPGLRPGCVSLRVWLRF